ncbi:uncharacterized protein LTR77_001594 [Saxophila tyrrhenica]|uniref:Uncharacterized protein n=1 Tax=Saxophila tyrrhenica TaxID=1690608 RepID=A0AAV9PQE8_9PEZI|nr:hypothetical protein LTR77_001594 [Saxophila tyrrhenica]
MLGWNNTMAKAEKNRKDSQESDQKDASKQPQATRWQKIHRSVGFQKGYNLLLFIVFAGAMVGFCLARLEYLNIGTYADGASPGEWYWYKSGHNRVAIILHLATVIPAGLLMVWQFLPIIRRKFLIFHRINGYVVTILLLLGVASAFMLARRSFGGAPATQAGIGFLGIIVPISLGMAIYNIKRLQIEQHRAWMLRTMFYCGTIITLRLIMIIAAQILPFASNYYSVMPCDAIATLTSPGQFRKSYPQCFVEDGTADGWIPVVADFSQDAVTVGAALQLGFSMGIWVAIAMHAIGVEIYLNLTSAETERLRMVSYEKQLEAGFKHPGSAGLTADRWGDVPAWEPTPKKEVEGQ